MKNDGFEKVKNYPSYWLFFSITFIPYYSKTILTDDWYIQWSLGSYTYSEPRLPNTKKPKVWEQQNTS